MLGETSRGRRALLPPPPLKRKQRHAGVQCFQVSAKRRHFPSSPGEPTLPLPCTLPPPRPARWRPAEGRSPSPRGQPIIRAICYPSSVAPIGHPGSPKSTAQTRATRPTGLVRRVRNGAPPKSLGAARLVRPRAVGPRPLLAPAVGCSTRPLRGPPSPPPLVYRPLRADSAGTLQAAAPHLHPIASHWTPAAGTTHRLTGLPAEPPPARSNARLHHQQLRLRQHHFAGCTESGGCAPGDCDGALHPPRQGRALPVS